MELCIGKKEMTKANCSWKLKWFTEALPITEAPNFFHENRLPLPKLFKFSAFSHSPFSYFWFTHGIPWKMNRYSLSCLENPNPSRYSNHSNSSSLFFYEISEICFCFWSSNFDQEIFFFFWVIWSLHFLYWLGSFLCSWNYIFLIFFFKWINLSACISWLASQFPWSLDLWLLNIYMCGEQRKRKRTLTHEFVWKILIASSSYLDSFC